MPRGAAAGAANAAEAPAGSARARPNRMRVVARILPVRRRAAGLTVGVRDCSMWSLPVKARRRASRRSTSRAGHGVPYCAAAPHAEDRCCRTPRRCCRTPLRCCRTPLRCCGWARGCCGMALPPSVGKSLVHLLLAAAAVDLDRRRAASSPAPNGVSFGDPPRPGLCQRGRRGRDRWTDPSSFQGGGLPRVVPPGRRDGVVRGHGWERVDARAVAADRNAVDSPSPRARPPRGW